MFSVILYMLRQNLRRRAFLLPFPSIFPSYCDVSQAPSYFASTTVHVHRYHDVGPCRRFALRMHYKHLKMWLITLNHGITSISVTGVIMVCRSLPQGEQWLKRFVAGPSPRRSELASGPVYEYVGLIVDKVALGQVFRLVFGLPLSISFHHGSPYSYIS
jgi:hypothetical protein